MSDFRTMDGELKAETRRMQAANDIRPYLKAMHMEILRAKRHVNDAEMQYCLLAGMLEEYGLM